MYLMLITKRRVQLKEDVNEATKMSGSNQDLSDLYVPVAQMGPSLCSRYQSFAEDVNVNNAARDAGGKA